MEKRNAVKFVFFGSSEFSVYALDELKLHSLLPSLIVTTPDKPKGRKMILTKNPVKVWGEENKIEVLDPASLKNNPELVSELKDSDYELFLVASYGKIIPPEIFEIPEHKTLNIHPSLLPKYRGASPIQSQILNDEKNVGVSIMQIDAGMDTGPVVVQKPLPIPSPCQGEGQGSEGAWGEVLGRKNLEKLLAIEGARLFAHILPEWIMGVIDPIMQNENEATYCQKISKEDGEIKLDGDPYKNFLKIKAFEGWPSAYFFVEKDGGKIRVIITEADFENGELKIKKVIPEGRKEMPYSDFLRGQK